MASPLLPGYSTTESGIYHPTDLRASDNALSDLKHPTAWLQGALGAMPVASGVYVSPQTSMALPAYYACMRVIAEDCAKLPFQVLERLPRGRQKLTDDPAWSLLHDRFNEDMSAMTAREVITAHAVGWGNGYAYILRDNGVRETGVSVGAVGEPVALYPLHPARVSPTRDPETRMLFYRIDPLGHGQDPIEFPRMAPADDILHIKGLGGDGICGYSVAQLAADSLGLSLAAQRYGGSFFGNGNTPSGILTHPGTLSDVAKRNLAESWANRPAQSTAVLEQGMSWQPIAIPPEQAQFLQTRQFQVIEVCRWFRMQPHKIGDLTNAHFTNIEHQGIEYVQDTLLPWLVRWEQEVDYKLLGGDRYCKHEVRGLLRGDMAAQSAFFREMIFSGVFTPNDALEWMDMNPYAQGDEHFMQSAMAPVSRIIDGTARQPRQPTRSRAPAIEEPEEEDDSAS